MENNLDNRPKEKRSKKILFALIMALIVLVSFVGGYFSRYIFEKKSVSITSDLVRIIEQFGYVIDTETGEMRELTESDYADAIVNGLLDEYSYYYTEEEYNSLILNRKGKYDGYGFSVYNENCVVYKVTGNSPADQQGLKAGDKIVSIILSDGTEKKTSTGIDLSIALSGIDYSSAVTFVIDRNGRMESITVTPSPYVASYIYYCDSETTLVFRDNGKGNLKGVAKDGGMQSLGEKTAYIRLDQFEGGAAEQLKSALEYMKERGRENLIFDLRDNGGGDMEVLVDIASYLIINNNKRNTVVAYSEGKNDTEKYSFNRSKFYDNVSKIAVLANENTASASECLIGAMLVYGDRFDKNSLIIEKNAEGVARTFGKGIMQTTYGLIQGGAFKLTTARILWPDKSTCIHAKGIVANQENAVKKGQSAIDRAVKILG